VAGTLAYMAPEVIIRMQDAVRFGGLFVQAGTNRMDIYR
jgi:hypothetical protein